MLSDQQNLIYLFIFCSGFLAIQLMISAGQQASVRLKFVNQRLRMMNSDDPQDLVYSKMKRMRGIKHDNQIHALHAWINRLVIQSGLPLGSYGIYAIMLGLGLSFALLLVVVKHTVIWGVGGLLLGCILPILILKFLIKRRRNKAVKQLPEALDVIVRSLNAGHPVPVAFNLVAKEMSDPLGSEFGMMNDEITFGSTISAALQRLADRVGQEDFDLFSAMVRLQEKTGGNLADLLASNANTIRGRQKMRLKIRAATAEGRMTAIILNVAPLLLFFSVKAIAPEFYGEVQDHPVFKKALLGVLIWMVIGNLIMRKMINFKI